GSAYEAGRSFTLLKVKTFHDAEATVLAHQAGAGRHKGRLGALLVRLPNGIEFSVGTGFSEAQRQNPPALGSDITFRYQELSEKGVPRFPSFVRGAVVAPVELGKKKSNEKPANTSSEKTTVVIAVPQSAAKPADKPTVKSSSAKHYFEF